MSNGRSRFITVQGLPGPTGPPGNADVNFVISRNPKLYYTSGTNLQHVQARLSEDLYVNIHPNNGETLNIYALESVVVTNNLNTSDNYSLFVLNENTIKGYFTSTNYNIPEFKTQISNLITFLADHPRIRFECVESTNFKWNLDMSQLGLLGGDRFKFNNIYINGLNEQQIAEKNLTLDATPLMNVPNSLSGVVGYCPRNDIFIRLPNLKDCYIGEEFNFTILKKHCNVYDELNLGICEHNEFNCDCILGADRVPRSYRALRDKKNINIYIFAKKPESAKDDIVFFEGPRIISTINKEYRFMKLDNEKACVNRCFKRCNNFILNPGSMSDVYSITIKVCPSYENFDSQNEDTNKMFVVTSILPELEYLFTTPDTLNVLDCNTNQVTIGKPQIFTGTRSCNNPIL